MRAPLVGLAALLALLAAPLSAIPSGGPVAAGEAGKPNVVIILTDDQRFNQMWPFRHPQRAVQQDLLDKGIEFRRGYVVNPLCCPSRTSILTGDYSHTTGVWRDTPPYGGYQTFHEGNESNTIATRLQTAGYTTGLFGKYLNGYADPALATGVVPPGWDQWMAFPRAGYTNYDLNVNGTIKHYTGDANYSTTVLGNAAANFIRTTPGPTFTYFAPYAPHNPAKPQEKYRNLYQGQLPEGQSPAFNEKDVRDKPAYIQARRRLSGDEKANLYAFRRDQVRTLRSVDDAVGTIFRALQDSGKLSNTIVFYLSDNGIQEGEHRWRSKRVPYEESIHVPFLVRYDPLTAHLPPGTRDTSHLVLNIDIAPTIQQLAGIAPTPMDGASLVPILNGNATSWRQKFLVEHLPRHESQPPPAYCAVHTHNYVFVYYEDGEQELYDLKKDRPELTNVVTDPAYRTVRQRLHTALRHLCVPPPPNMVVK